MIFGAVVFAVERLGVDVVVDQRGEHGAGNGGRVPAGVLKAAPKLPRRLAALWLRPATASRGNGIGAGGKLNGRGEAGNRGESEADNETGQKE
jgi:hypothetical protein